MIGSMLEKIRNDKGMSKLEVSRITGINIGHISHIEKGQRNPSHKALKKICKALDVPYQQLMYTYDKQLTEEQQKHNIINHISYNRVLAVDSINEFIECPSSVPSSAIAIKLTDNAMKPTFLKDAYVFVEFNSPLESKNIGLFSVNGDILVRRYNISRKGQITLSADNKQYEDIDISSDDEFYIIGKVCV